MPIGPCTYARKAGLENCVGYTDGLACAKAYIDVLEKLVKAILAVTEDVNAAVVRTETRRMIEESSLWR